MKLYRVTFGIYDNNETEIYTRWCYASSEVEASRLMRFHYNDIYNTVILIKDIKESNESMIF